MYNLLFEIDRGDLFLPGRSISYTIFCYGNIACRPVLFSSAVAIYISFPLGAKGFTSLNYISIFYDVLFFICKDEFTLRSGMDGIAALALSTEQQYMYPKQIQVVQLSYVIFSSVICQYLLDFFIFI